jgi:hypothetical protein
MDLTNEQKIKELLQAGAPDLFAIKEALDVTSIDIDLLLKSLYLIANVKRFTKWGKVSLIIQNGVVVRVQQEQGFKTE